LYYTKYLVDILILNKNICYFKLKHKGVPRTRIGGEPSILYQEIND